MARWRLSEKHYVYTDPPTEWEHVEIDLATGEQVRNRYVVPRFLDPDDPKLKNAEGQVVVCQGPKEHPKDVVFIGKITPTMLPLDEEAQALSDAAVKGDPSPIDALDPFMSESPSVLKTMQAQINALMLANDELQRRVAAQAESGPLDVAEDLAAHSAQQPKPAKERRL